MWWGRKQRCDFSRSSFLTIGLIDSCSIISTTYRLPKKAAQLIIHAKHSECSIVIHCQYWYELIYLRNLNFRALLSLLHRHHKWEGIKEIELEGERAGGGSLDAVKMPVQPSVNNVWLIYYIRGLKTLRTWCRIALPSKWVGVLISDLTWRGWEGVRRKGRQRSGIPWPALGFIPVKVAKQKAQLFRRPELVVFFSSLLSMGWEFQWI